MKKIIDGAVYNTETAKELGSLHNGSRGFAWSKETLYRTKSGKYFLHGEGGPQTQYGDWHGNTGSDGERIRPMSPQEARQWAEEKLEADEYAALFGEPDEAADGREALNLTVPAEIKRKLLEMRERTGKSISQIIVELVEKI